MIQNKQINLVKEKIRILTDKDSSHGYDHIMRVFNLSEKFLKTEQANKDIVLLTALLHDVDDYKLVGKENAEKLLNANKILNEISADKRTKEAVLKNISTMGYSKSLKGIRPTTIEGKMVSDADMCDALGSSGIIRTIVYAVSKKGSGKIFDKDLWPNVNISAKEYNSDATTHLTDSAINHFFEKSLKLKGLMMTNSGKTEATKRQKIMIDFLYNLFEEENAEDWKQFLDKYLKDQCKE